MKDVLSKIEKMAETATLEQVIELSTRRLQAYGEHPWVSLPKTATEAGARRRLLACVQRFSRSFQDLMLLRQALCADPRYRLTFRDHLDEELGHDRLIADRDDAEEAWDPLLEATLVWFTHQMVTLDNVEKAALVHLVLEAAGDKFHNVAAPVLGKHVNTGYFAEHAALDAGHAELGKALLRDQHASVYARLLEIVEQGWDMLEAASQRMVEIVRE